MIETAMVVVCSSVSSMFFASVMFPPPPALEILTLSVLFDNLKCIYIFYICLFYRPPSSTNSIFDTLFSYFECMDIYKFKNFVLLGDFSVNYDNPSHPMFSNLCTISNLYCLNQVVSGPTHEHHDGSRSTIDLVFVSEPSLLNQCDTISPLSNSDHLNGSFKETSHNCQNSGPANLALCLC